MRAGWLVLTVLVGLLVRTGESAAGPAAGTTVLLANLSHALEDRTLTITGWVENHGTVPISQLVIDARGFGPSGDLVEFGSDGIPWEISPGASERFSISLPIHAQLIRDYLVQVALVGPVPRVLASQRGSVSVEAYRSLLLARLGVKGDFQAGVLTVRSTTEGLPVAQVTARITVLVREFDPARFEVFTVDVDIPGGGSTTVALGVFRAKLLSVRILDIRLKATWTD